MFSRMIHVVSTISHKTPLLIDFLNSLCESKDQCGTEQVRDAYFRLVPRVCETFALYQWNRSMWPLEHQSYQSVRLTRIKGHGLAVFLGHCMEYGLVGSCISLTNKFREEANYFDAYDFEEVAIPLLQSLIVVLSAHNISLDQECYQHLYADVLHLYLRRYVQQRPQQPDGWRRPEITCMSNDGNFSDCKNMNAFLQDPYCGVFVWQLDQSRHLHVVNNLSNSKEKIEATAETARGPEGYRLVVTKVNQKYDAQLRSWKMRRDVASRAFATFDLKVLQRLLRDQYNDILQMKGRLTSQPTGHQFEGKIIRDISELRRSVADPQATAQSQPSPATQQPPAIP